MSTYLLRVVRNKAMFIAWLSYRGKDMYEKVERDFFSLLLEKQRTEGRIYGLFPVEPRAFDLSYP